MTLGEKVRLLAATGLLAATAAFASPQPVAARSLETQVARTEREQRNRERTRQFLLRGTAFALAGLAAGHAIKRAYGKKPTFLQPAAEHPPIAGAVGALSYAAAAATLVPDPAVIAFGAAVGGLPSYALAWGFSHVKPNYLINLPRSGFDAAALLTHQFATKNLEKQQRVLERMRAYVARPERVDVNLIDILFAQEKVDEALSVLKGLAPRIDGTITQNTLDKFVTHPLAAKAESLLSKNNAFGSMYNSLRQGKLRESLDAIDGFIAQQPNPSRFAARAYLVQTLADIWPRLQHVLPRNAQSEVVLEERAQESWQDAIDVILKDENREQKFVRMGESRNEVLEYAPNAFIKGLLVFKRCDLKDKARLQRERSNTQHVRSRIGKQICKSLAYVERDGKAYHVLRHEASTTLERILMSASPDERIARVAAAAGLLAHIHRTAPLPPTTFAHTDYYADRLRTTFYERLAEKKNKAATRALLTELRATGERVYGKLAKADIGLYKDANPRNWLFGDGSGIVAIDFEHSAILPVQLDLVSLLEFSSAPVSLDAKQAAFRKYFSVFYHEQPVDRRKFFTEYRWAGLQRHLELAGYRMRDREDAAAQQHIERARQYAVKLGENALGAQLEKLKI